MGNREISEPYRTQLIINLDDMFSGVSLCDEFNLQDSDESIERSVQVKEVCHRINYEKDYKRRPVLANPIMKKLQARFDALAIKSPMDPNLIKEIQGEIENDNENENVDKTRDNFEQLI